MEENNTKNKTISILQTAKKIFPHWLCELSLLALFVGIIGVSFTLDKTAPLSLELSLVNSNVVLDESGKEIFKNQQSQFSINNPEQENPIVTSKENLINTSKICFVGDSRFYTMQNVLLTDVSFITEQNANLEWLNSVSKTSIETYGDKIDIFVVSIGLNDIENSDAYLKTLNDLANNNENKNFIFVNVAPIDEEKYSNVTNKQIESFNKEIKKNINQKWRVIDLYQYVVDNKLKTADGSNYAIGDLANMFSWIIDSISKEMNV